MKLASGDYIDLKMYEPAMRHLIDTYIRAEESEKVSAFDDLSLVQLIVERGRGGGRRAAEGHPQERGSGGRDDREQRPQGSSSTRRRSTRSTTSRCRSCSTR